MMAVTGTNRFRLAERARTLREDQRAPFARLALSVGGEAALARFPACNAAIRG